MKTPARLIKAPWKLVIEKKKKNRPNPAGIYLLKVGNRSTTTRREICSKLAIKTPERRHWHRYGVFIVNLEHISRLVLVFLLLPLNMLLPTGES